MQTWLAQGKHGDMLFFEDNHDKRANPALLVDRTQSIISVRLDYLVTPPPKRSVPDNERPNSAIIARYARGRDYHKTMRGLLKTLAKLIQDKLTTDYPQYANDFVFRPFSDSAPIFERALAEQAGLGWTGKHTLLIHPQAGSFLCWGNYSPACLWQRIKSKSKPSHRIVAAAVLVFMCALPMPSAKHPPGIMMSMHGCVFRI